MKKDHHDFDGTMLLVTFWMIGMFLAFWAGHYVHDIFCGGPGSVCWPNFWQKIGA